MEHVLDAAQERAMSMFESGLNVALLGRAGSEKSVVLREMVRRAVGRWGVAGAVAVTALSGSAAVSVGGQTVHSLFGWDVRPMSKQDALELVRNRPRMFDKLNRIRVLFVDVAPTMSASLFSGMAHVMRHVAPANLQGLPFGDCQLICTFIFLLMLCSRLRCKPGVYNRRTLLPPFLCLPCALADCSGWNIMVCCRQLFHFHCMHGSCLFSHRCR